MRIITEIESYNNHKKTAVTLGKFDGLHRGHHKLIKKIQSYTSMHVDVDSVVFVMDMSQYLLNKGITQKLLMTNQERQAHLENEIDVLLQCPFTDTFASIEPEEFIKKILVDKLNAEYIVVGTDYRFGHDARGDVSLLAKYANKYGYQLEIVEKERCHNRIISSTYIRECLQNGEIELANELLGYPYSIQGIVEHGQELGRTLGFPTMNLSPEPEKLLPKYGVHLCRIHIEHKDYHGISNVGVKPTVTDEHRAIVETYVFDYNREVYDQHIQIQFCSFVRSEKKFSSIKELKEQVNQDILEGKKYLLKEYR